VTVELWRGSIERCVDSQIQPDVDYLVLDGIPRNVSAELMDPLSK
jgi:hypothetical protein